ncbi:MAG: right-handed parallel beta-helix repeat-containing protein, partial [Bacteroidales bacterium]|nr:right-handed parallel beta-helix repeat-containing protein [Bacteroidales bacterium]
MYLSKNLVLKRVSVVLILVTFTASVNATDYYISSSGNDTNNGLSALTPWKTIEKVNSVFSATKPGDRILFRSGDLFYGTIKITRSGLPGLSITLGSYGTGGKPLITGFTTLSSWTNEGNGIYSASVTSETSLEMVTIDGIQFGMGRYPNKEFLKYESFSTYVSITDNELLPSPNWKGAEAVIKKTNWIMDRCLITGHTGSTITYRSLGTYNNGTKDYGYFFQNDIKTLDSFGEWYYNDSKLFVYFGAKSPVDFLIKVSTVNNLINNSNGHDYITIENLSLSGSIKSAVHSSGSDYFVVQRCDIDFSGENGIYIQGGTYFKGDNNIINHSNRAGIYCAGGNNATITNNLIRYSGLIPGATNSATQNNGVFVTQNDNCLIQYNDINFSGGNGIYFTGNNVRIKNNFINNSSLILNDCAGIYTTGKSFSDRLIEGNIILNALGNTDGTPFPTRIYAEGIYIDAPSQDVDVINNTVAFCKRSGIFFHESHDNKCTGNTCFNNTQQIRLQFSAVNPTDIIRNIIFRDNILFAKTPSFLALYASSSLEDIPHFLVSDLNYYVRPADDDDVFFTYSPSSGSKYRTLQGWQSFTGQDLNSGKSPVNVKDTADIDFYYNATKFIKTITLAQPMIDVKGVKYVNSVTLEPYTSIILMVDPAPDQPLVPVFLSSAIQNSSPNTIEISYNVALSATPPPESSFAVKVNGATRNVTNVVISDTKIILTLETP